MGAVMATLDLPGVGAVDKRVAIGVGVAVVGASGFILWRRSQAVAVEGEPVAFDEGSLTDTGEFGGGSPWQYAATPTGDVGYTGADTAPRTNAEWGQRAQEALQGAGYDVTAASAAIGKYLARQPLNPAEAIMIQVALGLVGGVPAGTYSVVRSPATATPTPAKPTAKPKAYHTVRVDTRKAGFRNVTEIAAAHKMMSSTILADPKNAAVKAKGRVVTGDIVYVPAK